MFLPLHPRVGIKFWSNLVNLVQCNNLGKYSVLFIFQISSPYFCSYATWPLGIWQWTESVAHQFCGPVSRIRGLLNPHWSLWQEGCCLLSAWDPLKKVTLFDVLAFICRALVMSSMPVVLRGMGLISF